MTFKKGNNPALNITYNGTLLQQVTAKRILGIHFDNKLKFHQHADMVASSAKNSANILLQLTSLNVRSTINLYKAFCRSKLEYGVLIWGHSITNQGNFDKLQSAQRHGLRTIINASPSTPTAPLQAELNIPPN
jgi:hypothetical protein